jgi:glutaminyl-tRNA synthetase
MYDFAHGQSDSLEGITHSLCSLEYEIHRPLYDWFCEALGIYHPRQIEFARLNLSYTVMSKRKLLELVREGLVSGWDDPRLPTLCGLRRRGYTPEAIHDFCERIGVAKMDSLIDLALLEHCLREDLNRRALRRMAVLDPLRIVLTDYPEGKIEELECENNPEDPDAGTRKVMFCRELFIEREDFLENPPPKFFRLAPGVEIRLKNAYYIRCEEVVKDASGNIAFLRCSHDPASRGGGTAEGRKVKGTLHWVSASHAVPAEVRLYDRLFLAERPEDAAAGGAAETAPDADWKAGINPDSRIVRTAVLVEPALAEAAVGERFQFLRQGYFTVDPDSRPGRPVFNLSVRLKDSWEKIKGR